jgi:hypothetical protein
MGCADGPGRGFRGLAEQRQASLWDSSFVLKTSSADEDHSRALAKKYHVSPIAVQIRLTNLGLVPSVLEFTEPSAPDPCCTFPSRSLCILFPLLPAAGREHRLSRRLTVRPRRHPYRRSTQVACPMWARQITFRARRASTGNTCAAA